MLSDAVSVKPEEYDDLMTFLEDCYGHSRGFFQTYYPQTWKKDTIDLDAKIIVKDANKIVSHVGVFPLRLKVGQRTTSIGGIGGVATLPACRGQKLMGSLMEKSTRYMTEKEFSMAVLWGDRQRYAHFGYETCNYVTHYQVALRALKNSSADKIELIRYHGQPELLQTIKSLHAVEQYGIERSDRDYELIFSKHALNVYLARRNNLWAYAAFAGECVQASTSIAEVGGDPQTLLALLANIMSVYGVNNATVIRPNWSDPVGSALASAASNWSLQPSCMLKILNLRAIMETFQDQLPVWLKRSGCNAGQGGLTLQIAGSPDLVSVTIKGNQVKIAGQALPERIVLNELEMVRFLFGRPDGLEFFLHPLDHV